MPDSSQVVKRNCYITFGFWGLQNVGFDHDTEEVALWRLASIFQGLTLPSSCLKLQSKTAYVTLTFILEHVLLTCLPEQQNNDDMKYIQIGNYSKSKNKLKILQ